MSELRITGGGERSVVWNQIKADVLNMPVAGIAGSRGGADGRGHACRGRRRIAA